MKKNRIIAMFLAALTVFNMVPFINVGMELQAAVNMVVDFDSNLTRGDGTNTPKMNNAVDNVPQDSVYVKYPLTGNGKGYTLTYLLDKTTRIDFDVRYDSGVSKATGYFRVYKYNAGAWVKDSRFSPNMYSYTANVYLGADVFIDNTPVWESNQVHKVGANPTPPSHHVPEADDGYFFEVAVNGGFSFRYGDHDIHFMVDNQQVLHYTANGIKNGNIYNFYLLDNDDDHVVSKVQAFTGIDTNSIDFIPIVSDKDTAITDQTKFGTNPLRNDNYVLNYTNGEYPAAGEPTGSTSRNANVGMAIRFNEPMVFDYASMPAVDSPTAVTSANYGPTYKQPSATDMEIEVVMEMYHNLSSPQGQLRLTVDNILALPAVNAQTPKRPSAAFSNYPLGTANEPLAKIEVNEAFDEALINSSSYASYLLDSSGNPQNPRRVQVILNNLLPGAMFDGIVVRAKTFEYRSTSPTPTVTVPKEELGVSKLRGSIGTLFGKAFTFMAYTFTYDGVKFALQFIPYKGYGGTYQVKTQSGPSYERNSNGQDFISFDLTSLLPNTYQILFMPESLSSGGINWNNAIYSEKSIYYPDQATVDLGPAQNFIIEDYRLKPKDIYDNPDEYGKTGTLDLDLSWQIGMKVAIQSMYDQVQASNPGDPLVIKYSLRKSLTGEKNDTHKFGYTYIEITPHPTLPDEFRYDYQIFKIGAGLSENDFTSATFNPAAHQDKLMGSGTGVLSSEDAMYRVKVSMKDIPAERGPNVTTQKDESLFYYEKIYFLCVETYPESDIDKKSNFDSMSLSDITKADVPPVRDLKRIEYLETTKGFTEFKFDWVIPAEQLANYFHRTPYKPEDANYNFNVFISQDEAKMKELAKLNKDQLLEYVDGSLSLGGYDTPVTVSYKDYSAIAAGDPEHKGESSFALDMSPYISDLRNDDVVVITDMRPYRDTVVTSIATKTDYRSWIFEVTGVDKNQTYYIYVSFDVKHMHDPDDPAEQVANTNSSTPPMVDNMFDRQTSILSVLLGLTTKTDPAPPDGEDMRPPAPVVQIKDVSIDTATVYWEHAATPVGNEEVYYEIIRTKTNPIPSKYVNAYIDDMSELYAALTADMPNTELVILQTPPGSSGSLQIWNGTGFATADSNDYELVITEENVELKDKTLTSNEIYYYYVRTVRVTEQGKKMVSVFNYETCTTKPVSAPLNLRILSKTEVREDFDHKTGFVINFDVLLTNLDALGTDYNIEYVLKVDDAEFGTPVVLDIAKLKAGAKDSTAEELVGKGYYNFTYEITGLEQGTMYSIKVRVVNIKTKDTSSWSNTALVRTDMDQEEYNDENTVDSWLGRYRELINMLLKNTYWTIQDTKSRFSAVYRPSMFDSVISSSADGRIMLPTGDQGANQFTYYLPASSLVAVNAANKGFVSTYNNVEVIISPKTINTETNETVIEMVNKIEKKQIVDYYMMVSIEYKAYSQNVVNNPPLSENIVISFELVGASEKPRAFDDKTLLEYTTRIEKELADKTLREDLMKLVKEDAIGENVLKYLENRLKGFKNTMISETYTRFRKGIGSSTKIKELDTSIIISLKNADITTNATGYKWESQWVAMNTIAFGSGKAFYTNVPGSYIFAGVKIVIEGAENLPGATTAYTIISKYGLTDFLGYEGQIKLDGVATRSTVLNCAARMMGAQKGSDPVDFLKTKGYVISGAGIDSAATAQESVYVVMAVYEAKTKVKVSTLQIKNYTALSGVTGLNERYKPYIRAAHELGIYDATNMIPRSTISVRQLLDMLTALDKRANL